MKIDRTQIFAKCGGRCAYCGEVIQFKDMQVDHVIPNGDNSPDNLRPSCRVCNKWKSDFPVERFKLEVSEQLERLNRYSSNYRMAKKYRLIEERPQSIVFFFERLDTVNDK